MTAQAHTQVWYKLFCSAGAWAGAVSLWLRHCVRKPTYARHGARRRDFPKTIIDMYLTQ